MFFRGREGGDNLDRNGAMLCIEGIFASGCIVHVHSYLIEHT